MIINKSFRSLANPYSKATLRYFSKKVLITTPIYYVNAVPHIGHLYSNVLADVLTRYEKLKGNTVLLSTGTDEHGIKIYQAATKQHIEPQLFCDRVSASFKELTQLSNMDEQSLKFIRTSDKKHIDNINKIWNLLEQKGFIYLDKYEGWYSTSDEAFYNDKEVIKEGDKMIAIESKSEVQWTSEPTYKFKLSMFREDILNFINNNEKAILPLTRRNEIVNLLQFPLQDLSISRPTSRVKWGIPVPSNPSQTIYVWLDALFNYLTVTGYPNLNHEEYFPAKVHVIGKDILKFHTIYWYAFCKALSFNLPQTVLAHGHWTNQNVKMSKSKGNAIAPLPLIQSFGIDPIRYFLIRIGGDLNMDSDFSIDNLKVKYKKELLGLFGNLILRVCSSKINPQSKVPIIDLNNIHSSSQPILNSLKQLIVDYIKYMNTYQFNKSIEIIVDMLIKINQYLQLQQPWKSTTDLANKDEVLYFTFETLKICSILLSPIMPNKCDQILNILNISKDKRNIKNIELLKGWDKQQHELNLEYLKNNTLFPKID